MKKSDFVIAAAVRSPCGRVFNDFTHFGAYEKASEYLKLDIQTIFANWDEGFLTHFGRFLDRDEAYQLATTANQLITGHQFHGDHFLG